MSFPQNPKTIIVKNEYYPEGLTELDIWKYYQKVKTPFLMQLIGREIIVFFATDVNKTVVIRNQPDKRLIFITPSNYDEMISGRTLSLHSSMKRSEKFGIVDIDIADFYQAKEATKNIYFYLSKSPFISEVKIRFTGKDSFHVVCNMKRTMYIDSIRNLLRDYLDLNPFGYDVEHKRRKGIPNLDLSPNKNRGGFIALHSLSTIGLRCMEIPIRRIMLFEKTQAAI
jgi:hypothetical protein